MDFVLVGNKRQKKKIITPNTPEQDLHLAIETEDAYNIQKLLTTDIDLTSTVNGWTLLTAACAHGHENVVQVIINKLKGLVSTYRCNYIYIVSTYRNSCIMLVDTY